MKKIILLTLFLSTVSPAFGANIRPTPTALTPSLDELNNPVGYLTGKVL